MVGVKNGTFWTVKDGETGVAKIELLLAGFGGSFEGGAASGFELGRG